MQQQTVYKKQQKLAGVQFPMEILKVLTMHDDEYSSLGSIKSRYNGTEVIIDISMSFSNSTTFSEIAALQKAMQEELSGEIENSHIAIVID